MLSKYIIAVVIILAAFAGWVVVQHLARMFAARHPELGPAREEGGGCGISCHCTRQEQAACLREKKNIEQESAEGAKRSS